MKLVECPECGQKYFFSHACPLSQDIAVQELNAMAAAHEATFAQGELDFGPVDAPLDFF